MKGLLVIVLLFAALVAGAMGYQTGEWQGWAFAALFACAAGLVLKKGLN